MELKTDDILRIVNDNHERFKEQEKLKMDQEQQLIEKNQKVERVKKTAIILGLGFVLGVAPTAKVISDGRNEIVKEFDEATSEYGITYHPSKEDAETELDKYVIHHGSTYINTRDGINGMIDAARDNGMNDIEIAIGLNSVIKDYVTEGFIDTSLKERCNQCIQRSVEKGLSGEYKNGK